MLGSGPNPFTLNSVGQLDDINGGRISYTRSPVMLTDRIAVPTSSVVVLTNSIAVLNDPESHITGYTSVHEDDSIEVVTHLDGAREASSTKFVTAPCNAD